MTNKDKSDLYRAKTLLENPGLAARLAHRLGSPIERGFEWLPEGWGTRVQHAARVALWQAMDLAIRSLEMRRPAGGGSSEGWHKWMVGASGGLGGAFGLAALPVELPVSTTLILRSIAEIAREEGQDMGMMETRLNCLEVYALGGRRETDDAAENAYWVIRAGLAKAVSEAAAYLARRGIADQSAPVLVRFIGTIAARFGIVVSQQVAAKAIPVVGAATGSAINVLFMGHFQNMARGHFIVKRLESRYGTDLVRETYADLEIRKER